MNLDNIKYMCYILAKIEARPKIVPYAKSRWDCTEKVTAPKLITAAGYHVGISENIRNAVALFAESYL